MWNETFPPKLSKDFLANLYMVQFIGAVAQFDIYVPYWTHYPTESSQQNLGMIASTLFRSRSQLES